jgi:hypothetical protein
MLLNGAFLEKLWANQQVPVFTPVIFPHFFVRAFSAKNSLLVNLIDQHDVTRWLLGFQEEWANPTRVYHDDLISNGLIDSLVLPENLGKQIQQASSGFVSSLREPIRLLIMRNLWLFFWTTAWTSCAKGSCND